MGTIRTMTASPAKTDGPNSSHRNTMDRMICRGQDHSRWMKLVTSLKRWASADIRFTVSPTVDSLRASLETSSALEQRKERLTRGCDYFRGENERKLYLWKGHNKYFKQK